MPHKHHNPSGTLAPGRSIAGATASARTPDQSPDQSGVTAFTGFSQPILTDADAERYLTLKDRHTPDAHGAFEWAWEHSRATGTAREILLNLAWRLDGETATDPDDSWPGYQDLSLYTSTNGHTAVDLEPIADAVTELIALGELLLINQGEDPDAVALDESLAPMFPGAPVDLSRACPTVGYVLPGYQQWLTREVAPNPWDSPETSLQGRYDDDRKVIFEPSHNHEVGIRVGNQAPVWVDALDLLRVVSHAVLGITYGPSPTEQVVAIQPRE